MPMIKLNKSARTNPEGEAMSASTKVPPAKLARVVEWIRHYLYRLHQRLTPAPAAMMEMIVATWTSQAITVAAQLGVADALADGPLPIEELAAQVGADADALGRLLRALISKGIFRHRRDGRYELNPLAGTLRSDAPISMTWAAQFYGSAEQRERWTLMVDAIRTGKTVVPALRGKESFDYFAGQPELAELFNQTMTSVSELTDGTVVAGYDFSAYPTIVDVGGGHGPLLAAILAGAPASRGILYDLSRFCTTCSELSPAPQTCCANTKSPTGCVSRRGRFLTVFRPVVTPTSSRTSSTTGPTKKRCRSCVTSAGQPAPEPRCCWSNWSSPSTTVISPGNGWIWRCC